MPAPQLSQILSPIKMVSPNTPSKRVSSRPQTALVKPTISKTSHLHLTATRIKTYQRTHSPSRPHRQESPKRIIDSHPNSRFAKLRNINPFSSANKVTAAPKTSRFHGANVLDELRNSLLKSRNSPVHHRAHAYNSYSNFRGQAFPTISSSAYRRRKLLSDKPMDLPKLKDLIPAMPNLENFDLQGLPPNNPPAPALPNTPTFSDTSMVVKTETSQLSMSIKVHFP